MLGEQGAVGAVALGLVRLESADVVSQVECELLRKTGRVVSEGEHGSSFVLVLLANFLGDLLRTVCLKQRLLHLLVLLEG